MYDLIIIWAWSAWYPAWMYASRYKIKNLIIWSLPGWALWTSHKVENYPWTISAPWKEIMENFRNHALESWSEIINDFVNSLEKKWDIFYITTASWKVFESKYVILATWNNYKKLWIPTEETFFGKWVSYCATCDGMFFKNLNVWVVWWWNTAITEALYLSEICKKVYIIHRRDTFRAENTWVELAKKHENIEFILNDEIVELSGSVFLEKAILKSWKEINIDWIFVAIWSNPNINLVEKFDILQDEEWCLVVDKRQSTSIPWLYRAWDVTTNSNKFRQTIMSAREWCLAANSIHEDLIKRW